MLAAAVVAGMRRAGGRARAVAVLATGPLAAAVAVPLPAGSASAMVTVVLAAVLLAAIGWAVGLSVLVRRFLPVTGPAVPSPARPAAESDRQEQVARRRTRPAPHRSPPGRSEPGRSAPGRSVAGQSVAGRSEFVRQAAAVGLAVGLAFVLAAFVLPAHLSWAPLTALLVGAGAVTWHDAAHLGARRLGGATAGAVLATLALLLPHGRAYPLLLAVAVLVGATWLRPAGYAWWAGGLTAALVLLAGDTGSAGTLDLGFAAARIAAIAAGGILAIAAAWALLPRPPAAHPPAGTLPTGRS